jgi:N-acyl homoserine lactone hydrolase
VSGWQIDALQCGLVSGVPKEDILFKDRSHSRLTLPLTMFVLRRGPRTIVVDTGGPTDVERVRAHHGFGYTMSVDEEPLKALARIGVAPDDVDLVVNTHLHWDHCGNNDLFTRARVMVQAAELAYAAAPCAAHRTTYDVMPGLTPMWALERDRIDVVNGSLEIAEGVALVPLPGHSPGSQGVRVDTDDGPYIITGDCVPTYENWVGDAAMSPRPAGNFTDLIAFCASLDRLSSTGWTPLPSHDPDIVRVGRFGRRKEPSDAVATG